ncbi:MAG: hypothetical protein PHH58_03365 [Rhodoferax sp.]|nr:hypothetical protein [Rhodoferax sp.]
MSRTLHTITLSVTLQAPYLVHGNDAGRFGLDTTLLFDHLGRPILPGTLLAGRIAQVWRNHSDALGHADATVWFGQADQSHGTTQQQRARLQLADLVLVSINGKTAGTTRTHAEVARTALDDATGSVKQGALLITEQISAAGAELTFEGSWHTWAGDAEVKALAQQLRAALLLQTQVGAYRGVGFGRLLDCRVNSAPSATGSTGLGLPASARLRLGLQFDAPLCVNSSSRRGNVFVAGDVLPGGTLLGALAQTLLQQHAARRMDDIKGSALATHFDALRCTHALPGAPGKGRPMPLPQSLVAIDIKVVDTYSKRAPTDFDKSPAFQTDWKPATLKAASKDQGWRETARHLRVRTAMQDGKAADSQLFAYDCIYAPPNAPVQWQCDLDLSAVPADAQAAVRQELGQLLGHGLGPIGKTDARARVECIKQPQNIWPSQLGSKALQPGQLVPMMLVSDTLLFTTNAIADQANVDLHTLYQGAFDDLAAQAGYPGVLTLSHFFATQQLRGGEPLHRRYLRQKNAAYQPLVLTQAGSVFVFQVTDPAKAAALLQTWQANGLALPQTVREHHGDTWCDHPYIRQNGYGEVVVQAALPFKPL